MQCECCSLVILQGEQRELHGRILCEDCYIDLLSQPKACDPWAVYSAKSFLKKQNSDFNFTPSQEKILNILRKEGNKEPSDLCQRLQIKETDLERDIATLRHMEKIRGELKDGKKFICLW